MCRVRFLRKADFFFTGNGFAWRQVPGIERFVPFQVNIDHPATHELHQRPVGVPTLHDGNQRIGARHHEQEKLRHESFPSPTFRHDEQVRVTQARIKRRKGYQLAVRGLKKHQAASSGFLAKASRQAGDRPRAGSANRVPACYLPHRREPSKEKTLCASVSGIPRRAVHARDRMQYVLPAVGKNPFRGFCFEAVPCRLARCGPQWSCSAGSDFEELR